MDALKSLRGLRPAIYARYSSDGQREASIEDQVRRVRVHLERLGGTFDPALVFADHAISGASLNRPAFEAMMAKVKARNREIDVILTEDISRVTRDFADGAMVFRELQYLGVPLIGVSDGIDTSVRGAKLSFTVKNLLADMFLDDLRDKTLRGLEGRALAGCSTGGLPIGYRSEPVHDAEGKVISHRIMIDEEGAAIVRRVFDAYIAGRSLAGIAKLFNAEAVPPPRAKTRHRRKGWVDSTIRGILHNESYIGRWSFKEREWVKVPGTNRRMPRKRAEADVMRMKRPELRVIDDERWEAAHARLAVVRTTYTRDVDGEPKGRSVPGRQNAYLFSGLLECDRCSASMVIVGGSSSRYYRCGSNFKRGVCDSCHSVKESVVRMRLLEAIRGALLSSEGIEFVRREVVERLGAAALDHGAELLRRRDRLAKTENKIRELVSFIADGNHSTYVVQSLNDLETQARDEKAAIVALEEEARVPIKLPTPDEVIARVFDLEARLAEDPLRGREELRRYFRNGTLRLEPQPDGTFVARGEFLPMVALLGPNALRPDPGLTPGPAVYSGCCGGRI